MWKKNVYYDDMLEKPKTSKLKVIGIAAIIIFSMVSLTSYAVYAFVCNSAKATILNAIKATNSQINSKESFINKITDKDFTKTLKEAGTKQGLELTLNSTNQQQLRKYNGYGLSISLLSDDNKKKLMFDAVAKHNDKEIVDTEFYTDNKKLMLAMPKLYSGWFTCDADNIQAQYNSSYFAKSKKELPSKEFSIKLFGDDNGKEYSDSELVRVVINDYIRDNQDKLKKIGKDIKVSKLKDTKTIEASGQKEECTGYYVVIPGKDAKEFIDSICDYMLEDKQLQKTITKYANYAYLIDNKNYNSSESMVDDIYSKMHDSVNKIKDEFSCDDINAAIYVDPKGRAVSIETNTYINLKEKRRAFKSVLDFRGYQNVANKVNMSVELEGDKENLNMKFNSNSTKDNDTFNDEADFTIRGNSADILNYKRKYQYNTKTGEFNASDRLGTKGKEISGVIKGNGKYDANSKTLKLDLSNIDLKSSLGTPINISLSGSYSLSPMDSEIKEPSGEKVEIFKATKDEILSITKQIHDNLNIVNGVTNPKSEKA